MYQLLVADDDPTICRSLETRYDWAAMEFEVAGAFSDGNDGINCLGTAWARGQLPQRRQAGAGGFSPADWNLFCADEYLLFENERRAADELPRCGRTTLRPANTACGAKAI